MAWYWAVVDTSGGKSALELEKEFSPSRKHPSCIWFKYRNGLSAPRDGSWGEKSLHLVDQVAHVYPQTLFWWTCPLWRLLNPKPMDMNDIKTAFEWLPDDLKMDIFREPVAEGQRQVFWRKRETPIGIEQRLLKKCFKRHDIYGLTAIAVLMREADVIQAEELFKSYKCDLISFVQDTRGKVFPTMNSRKVEDRFLALLIEVIGRLADAERL